GVPWGSLPAEQRPDVFEELVGADRAVALFGDHPVDHVVNALELFGVGRLGRGRDLHDVAEVREQLLLDRLAQSLVARVLEALAAAGERREPDQDLLPERLLGGLGDADLLLDRPHQPLVGLDLFLGDGVAQLRLVAERLDVVEVVVQQRLSRLLEGVDERALDLALGDLVVLAARLGDQVDQPLALFAPDGGVLLEPVLERAERVDRVDAGDVLFDEGVREPVDHVAWADAVHALAEGLLLELADVAAAETVDVLPVVQLHLLDQAHAGLLRFLEPRQDGEHRGDLERVRRQVDVAQAAVAQQLLVDPDLLRDAQVVGDPDDDDPVLQRLGALVGDERLVLGLVRVRDDDLVGVDHREAARLDALFLRERQERVEELLVALQHLDELHQAAVGDVELAVEAVGARVGLDAVLADRREVDRPGQLGDVLALRVGGGERADAATVLLREDDPLDRHRLVAAVELLLQAQPADRAEVALDIDAVLLLDLGPEHVGDEVERLLVHGAALDRVHGAVVGTRIPLEPALEERDDRRLSAADRPHEQQDALAHLEAARGGAEVLD